jgi:uncharacterized caspase-like protein
VSARRFIFAALLLLGLSPGPPPAQAQPAAPAVAAPPLRRFALVAGNNEGGPDTRPLLYATSDARKIHDVLTEIGGVARGDVALLLDGSAQDFLDALHTLEGRAAQAARQGQRTSLLIYYSGHAKEGSLRLGRSRLDLEGLKQRLAGPSPAHVRIGIFDACRSGVVNRTKGARKGPGFEIQADGAHDARGLVLLTSSSGDEDSQESDAIAGSYFSHHLMSGLRGSADRSGDRRVTLSEAYEYAYARTVAETAETAAGAQHPTFDYDLKGNGNLVLSELSSRGEGVYLPPQAPAGIYYLVEAGRGVVSAEVLKLANAERVVALSAGRYQVKRRLPDRLRLGHVQIPAGRLVTLDEASLRDAPFSDDPVKGAQAQISRLGFGLGATVQSFFDAPTRAGLFPPTALLSAELMLRHFFRRDWVWALDLAAGSTRATLQREPYGVSLPFRFSEVDLGTSLFAEWPLLGGRLTPYLGGRLAFMFLTRTFQGEASGISQQHLSTFSPGLVTGLQYRLGGGLGLAARARVHYLLYNVDENRSLGYWELAGVVVYEL